MPSVPQPSVQQVDVHWCHRCYLGRSLLLEFFDGRLLYHGTKLVPCCLPFLRFSKVCRSCTIFLLLM
ncbi:hypothetical protein CLOM_g24042 [Closterium sp. NIES-68]|nr:hypothetical protein CLOM_g24042 [Closterium sp. NIES-68]GJP67821.1 hypothetical protein CLOP_g24589 [Closterium sp. NIES-67]GJP85312.1 hypothetical protein CLOP_g15420 [Closterium sp. NIES-67]